MDDELIKSLLKKATGYTFDEVVEEYAVKEDGAVELTKRKVTKKHFPPDSSALKAYIELSQESTVSELTDEELKTEKARLMKELGKVKSAKSAESAAKKNPTAKKGMKNDKK